MMVCFASFNEELAVADDDPVLDLPDAFCLLEQGHAGEHEWTPQSEIGLKWETA